MRRRWLPLLGVVVAALAGCGQTGTTATGGSTPTASATATPSPTAAAKIDQTRATALLTAAAIPANGLVSIGGDSKPYKTATRLAAPGDVCGWALAPRAILTSSQAKWYIDITVAEQDIFVYESPEAPAVLTESRKDTGRCAPFQAGGISYDQHAELTLPASPGAADAYGFCDRLTFTDTKEVDYTCMARLSSADGHVITDVWAFAKTAADAKSATTAMAPLAAQRLAKLPVAA